MGKTLTAPYAYEMQFSVAGNVNLMRTDGSWFVRSRNGITGFGRPTAENLRKMVEHFEASTAPGGCNEHIGRCTVMSASVYHNTDLVCPQQIAKYVGPMFVLV